jgi:hypothetical protein
MRIEAPSSAVDRTEAAIAQATQGGWQILNRDAAGIQFRKPKQWSKGAVIFGVILLLFWGFGLVILFLAALDYLIAKDRLAYVSTADLAAGKGPQDPGTKTSVVAWVLAGLLALIVLMAILGTLFA